MRKALAALVLLFVMLRRPAPAHAEWYGWQILLADAATFAFASASQNPGLTLIAYVVAAPAIHAAHGDGLEAAGSVGLRLGLPVAGLLLQSCGKDDDACAAGPLLGIAAAMLLDAAFLSTHIENVRPGVEPLPGGGAVVSMAGRF